MKKYYLAIQIVVLLFLTSLISSCISEPDFTADHYIINTSGHDLTLYKYGQVNDTIEIVNNTEYRFTYHADEPAIPVPFYDSRDSIIIRFDDNKKLVYMPDLYLTDTTDKNIYEKIFYEDSEINTGKHRYYHLVFKFYLTAEDYNLAKQ